MTSNRVAVTALAGAALAALAALAGCAGAHSTAAAPSPAAKACGVIAAATASGPVHVDAAFVSSVERYVSYQDTGKALTLYNDFSNWTGDTENLYAVPTGNPDTAGVDAATIALIGQGITADKKAVTADCAAAGVALHLG